MNIGFTKLDSRAPIPVRATVGSLGYDLALLEETSWRTGETKIAPCGLRLADGLPKVEHTVYDRRHEESFLLDGGIAMMILPRSSLFLKHGLIIPNSPGLVDLDYTGPIGVVLWRPYNPPVDAFEVVLSAGTRVAQAVFVPVALPNLVVAEPVDRPVREGFGSTG